MKYRSFAVKSAAVATEKCVVEEVDGRIGSLGCCEVHEYNNNNNDWREVTEIDRNTVGSVEFMLQMPLFAVKGTSNSLPTPHYAGGVGMGFLKRSVKFSRLLKFMWIWYTDFIQTSGSYPPHCCQAWGTEFRLLSDDLLPTQFDGEVVLVKSIYGKVHPGIIDGYGCGVVKGQPNLSTPHTIQSVRRLLIKCLVIFLAGLSAFGILGYFLVRLVVG